MKICPNCKNKENAKVCSHCGTKMTSTTLTKVGVAVRLVLFGLMLSAASVVTILSIPELISQGFISGLTDGILIYSALVATAFIIMVLIKWGIFIFPKSFRIANDFASNLVAFSLFGLGLKLMLWASALLFPFGIGCSVCSSLLMAVAALLMYGRNIFIAALFLVLMLALASGYVLIEIKKWSSRSFKELFSGNTGKKAEA